MVGIDRYRAWNRLSNAVSDATSVLQLFTRLGFEPMGEPLLDDLATGDALRRLATTDLAALGPDDCLLLFFAGHGQTLTRTYADGTSVKDGYLIPVDGELAGAGTSTWLRLESWLTDVTRSPAMHILVVLDACHSGIALGPIIQWRTRGAEQAHQPLEQLRARRSRRIITSALDDQLAMDGGPVPGHSLFTGCLMEALTGGLAAQLGPRVVTGSEIAHYVQRRVSDYPGSRQTPDFGALELDDRGELIVRIAEPVAPPVTPPDDPTSDSLSQPKSAAVSGIASDPASGPQVTHAPRWKTAVTGLIGLALVGSSFVLWRSCSSAPIIDRRDASVSTAAVDASPALRLAAMIVQPTARIFMAPPGTPTATFHVSGTQQLSVKASATLKFVTNDGGVRRASCTVTSVKADSVTVICPTDDPELVPVPNRVTARAERANPRRGIRK